MFAVLSRLEEADGRLNRFPSLTRRVSNQAESLRTLAGQSWIDERVGLAVVRTALGLAINFAAVGTVVDVAADSFARAAVFNFASDIVHHDLAGHDAGLGCDGRRFRNRLKLEQDCNDCNH